MIDPISTVTAAETFPQLSPAQASGATDFASWLSTKLAEVNTQISQADTQVRQLAVGNDVNLHEVMISLEKARLSMELVVQVRNKLLDAYQNLMQMQV